MTQVTESPAAAGTATTAGARAHAREQHGRTVGTMRFVPASTAPARLTEGLPDGVSPTWAESLAFGRYTTMALARGTRIRLTDTAGDACVHALLYRSGALHERLNIADTVKVPWQAYPSTGHPLLSDAGRLMATIVADTSSRHDALTGATTLEGNTASYGAGTAHSYTVGKGQYVQVLDVAGSQCSDFVALERRGALDGPDPGCLVPGRLVPLGVAGGARVPREQRR